MRQHSYADLLIERARGASVVDTAGVEYTDLFCGAGTVLLGHADPRVTEALHRQVDRVWNTGALRSVARERAAEALARFTPGYRPIALYSTGMEAAEFALRVARVGTGRAGFIGFDGSMHGKSMATAYLGWANAGVDLPAFHRLPRVPDVAEDEVLARTRALLGTRSIAAVFVEPLQASAGGHAFPPALLRAIAAACREAGTLLVCDEIFTGLFRAGPAFLHQEPGIEPDLVLAGKAMGNGFPVSAVIAKPGIEVVPAMLPASTYAANPLAAAVVEATLARLHELDAGRRVERIERVIEAELAGLAGAGVAVRGRGALWVIELGTPDHVARVAALLMRARVLVSTVGRCLRLLPPVIIGEAELREACAAVRRACVEACR